MVFRQNFWILTGNRRYGIEYRTVIKGPLLLIILLMYDKSASGILNQNA